MAAAETSEQKLARLEAENEQLKVEIAEYVRQKQADSEAFGALRAKLQVFADAARGVVTLHEEHLKSGV